MRLNRLYPTLLFVFVVSAAQAQYGPRLFLDLPSIFFNSPDVAKFNQRMGAGLETALNVGTHWSVARLGGGATYTLDPRSNEIGQTTLATPYFLLEGGLGRYRSNGNKCARTHRPAFTALVTAGVRYDLYTGKNRPEDSPTGKLDYTVGVELGYFYIRDIFRNTEVFLRGNYRTKAQAVGADFGFKMFLNLRADRD